MLKEITIESYKSLKNVTVQFKDGLNIIIGKNGSGKSNLLEFISKVSGPSMFFDAYKERRFPDEIFEYESTYLDENENSIDIRLEVYKGGLNKNFVAIARNTKTQNSAPVIFEDISQFGEMLSYLSNNLTSILIKYHMPDKLMWMDRTNTFYLDKKSGIITEEFSGDFFLFTVQFYHYLQQSYTAYSSDFIQENNDGRISSFVHNRFNEFKAINQIDKMLSRFSPIDDVVISKNINVYTVGDTIKIENLSFDFRINDQLMPWSYLSDGTKRIFFLISQVLCSNSGNLLLIEEPELGIHPHQLYRLMQFIKEQSEEKQIIVSTHSPVVLDCLSSDELDRITIAETKNGNSQFRKMDEAQKEKGAQYMNEVAELSYYWLHSDLEEND